MAAQKYWPDNFWFTNYWPNDGDNLPYWPSTTEFVIVAAAAPHKIESGHRRRQEWE
jgi:hypothetical protein